MDTLAQFVTSIDSQSDVRITRDMSSNLITGNGLLEDLREGQRKEKRPGIGNKELDLEAIGKKIRQTVN